MHENKIVIVGGGIAGLLAGLWAQMSGHQAIIIERAKECGGLLRSSLTDSGHYFDYGTHIPGLTGNQIVDELLFGRATALEWIEIPKLKKGNFFRGQLNTNSQFVDVRKLPQKLNIQALSELINSLTTDRNATNLAEALELHFGKTLTNEVFKPLLKRIYKTPLESLDPNSHRFLAYARVIVASSEVSNELKKSPIYDAKIAHPNSQDGGLAAKHLYPLNHGTGEWVQAIVKRFKTLGGTVMTDTAIKAINGNESTILLESNDLIQYKKLIWTAPIALLARSLFPEMQVKKPAFVPTGLHHFVLDRMPLCDSHYVYINEPDANAFRVTLYSNITQLNNDYRISVEAVANEANGAVDDKIIFNELKNAKIIPEDAEILESHSTFLPYGFPEMTLEMNAENEVMRKKVSQFEHIVIGGRGAGEAFFMNDVLKGLASSLTDCLGQPSFSSIND